MDPCFANRGLETFWGTPRTPALTGHDAPRLPLARDEGTDAG